jgi:hypothetical protein
LFLLSVAKCCSVVMVLVIRCPTLLKKHLDSMKLLLIYSFGSIVLNAYLVVFLFNTIIMYIYFMSMYSYCILMYLHRGSWHSSANLTEVYPCFFLSCEANARVKPAMTGHGPQSSKIFVLFHVLFVLCRSVYCFCVNVYYTTATGWLSNCS